MSNRDEQGEKFITALKGNLFALQKAAIEERDSIVKMNIKTALEQL